MAILFAGGEMEDVTTVGTVAPTTTNSTFRSTYARQALDVAGSTTFAANYARAAFSAGSLVGVTARVYSSAFNANNVFFWLATGGAGRLRLKVNSTSPATVTLESYNGTTATTLATSSLTVASAGLIRLDLLIDYQASGRVRLWVDGVLYIDYSGNTAAGGGTTLDSVNFGPFNGAASPSRWSEIIVTDGEDPRPLSLKTLVPNGAGDTSAWTGAYTDVDDVTASDTDVMSSGTAAQVTNFDCTGMPSGGSGLAVRAVKVVASALRGASGPQKMQLGVKSGSTEGWSADLTLDTGYTAVSNTWTLNPATSAAFTSSEIDSLKLAVKSIA
jgi:hypothetical protein